MNKIFIRKPLWGNFVYLRDTHLREPELEVETPNGVWIIDTEEWERTGKVMMKEFKIPGKPMKLVGNDLEGYKEQ